jgi:hypothetical protein
VKIQLPVSRLIILDSPDHEKTYFRQLGRDVVPEPIFGIGIHPMHGKCIKEK